MSTDLDDDEISTAGAPELTPLGKRIELLRIERRMSKRILANRAGTSRQQLWRVMTGKSELTSSLCARLSEVLEIDSRTLRDVTPAASRFGRALQNGGSAAKGQDDAGESVTLCQTLEEYVSQPNGLERTLETLPLSQDGRRLKRALLDAIEDIAIDRALKLPQIVFDLRRSAINDDDP